MQHPKQDDLLNLREKPLKILKVYKLSRNVGLRNNLALRNKLLQEIWDAGGRLAWKKTSGHHRRSLVETHMFRLKTILGGTLRGRNFTNQQTEAIIMANILNKMTHLGMPKSEKILYD